MATIDAPHDAGRDPRRLVPLAIWSGLGLIALVLLCRSASGAFTRPIAPVVPCLLGLVSIALSLCAWWYDDLLAAPSVAGVSDPGRWNNRPTNQSAYARSLHGLASLIAPLTIGLSTAGGATSVIGILLGVGLLSAAGVLAISWELEPRFALQPRRQLFPPTPHVENLTPPRETVPTAICEPARDTTLQDMSPFADPGVSQQVTRRTTPDDLDCIEALLRVTFAAGERETAVHLPIHPPLPGIPAVECEPLEDDDVEFKVTTAQPYGVRIEIRRNGDCNEARTLAVGVAMHARNAAEAAA